MFPTKKKKYKYGKARNLQFGNNWKEGKSNTTELLHCLLKIKTDLTKSIGISFGKKITKDYRHF